MKKLLLFLFITSIIINAQYITPGTGVNWNLDNLVANSGGVITGSFPNYTLINKITVSATDIITIPAGSILTCNNTSAGFEVNGAFSVNGTQTDTVKFISTTQDSVNNFIGLRFNDTVIDSLCKINYAYFRFAKVGVHAVGADVTVSNSIFFQCGRGFQLSTSNSVITNCTIERSYEYGITMTLGASPTITYCTLKNNNTQNTSAKNQISIGTQGINSPIILHNEIIGGWNNKTGGISISCLFGGSASAAEVAYNNIYNNSYGIALAGGTITANIHHNNIYNNKINPDASISGSGINVNGNSANTPIIAHNVITNNHWGITIQNGVNIVAGPQPVLGELSGNTVIGGYNVITANVQGANVFDLFNNCINDVKAMYNDWGVYDSLSIEGHIVHKADSSLRGFVSFIPFLPPTPVELVSFSGNRNGKSVELTWITSSEKNNFQFIIEKSSDKNTWTTIGTVKGNGTTTEISRYSFSDILGINESAYYRLKQMDISGVCEILTTVKVESEGFLSYSLDQNYPNPFNPSTKINYTIPASGMVSIKVFDVLGNEVKELINEFKETGSYAVTFDASELVSGVYFYSINTGQFKETKKMILIR